MNVARGTTGRLLDRQAGGRAVGGRSPLPVALVCLLLGSVALAACSGRGGAAPPAPAPTDSAPATAGATAAAPSATPSGAPGRPTAASVASVAPPTATPGAPPTPPADVAFPGSVTEAEAEAQHHPQAAPPPLPGTGAYAAPGAAERAAWFAEAPGSAERDCVDVDQHPQDAVRAGEFVAGPFVQYRQQWARDPRNATKLWWIPLHSSPMPGLTVRAILLDDPAVRQVVTPPRDLFASTAVGLFYPSTVELPAPGRWLLVATAGPDWGCFLLTLGE